MSVKDGRCEEQKFRMKGPLSRLWPTLSCRRVSQSRRLLNRRMFLIFKERCFLKVWMREILRAKCFGLF
jgi:hypothetical protein